MALKLSQEMIGGCDKEIPRSRRTNVSQDNSAVVEDKARYSASALERATVLCFLALQEIQVSPRKVQKPVVERRVDGQPP